MAQRRAAAQTKMRKAESSAPTEDFDFLASQQSTGSDDNALQLAVAQQLMASKEKKRKDLEKKFFQAAKNKLTNQLTQAADDVQMAVETTEQVYTKFLIDYASSEDAIRALWMQIKEAEQKLIEIADRKRALNEELRQATEKAQIAGMAQVKEACHDTRTAIATIMPGSM
ncbi:hypothetical protein B0H15DRAFT_954152 [Mycena belliarum]|uniref:Uncharacterized protein n=1 Tax=Mycena belliarum TaxID=1033014 RepID=A0AAD6TTP6_9AGAR|nr:hypothetical protein B0H15DRAFT_954152 [Mycena belliae]